MREQRVLDYLNKHKIITTFEAFNDSGNTRLSASIFELRKEYDIEDIFVSGKNKYGDTIKWRAYFFSKDRDYAMRKLQPKFRRWEK